MPSPDVSNFTDLVLYDVDPQDLVADALDLIPDTFNYAPQEGDPDLELMGSLATICAPVIYALNRVPNGVVDVLSALYGVVRNAGTPATGSVSFTVDPSPLGIEIPAGTVLALDLGDGTTLTWVTDTAVVSAANAATVTATITATDTGAQGNNIPAGTTLDIRSPLDSVEGAALTAATAGGQDPESDASWLGRFVGRTTRLTSTLVRPEHFQQAALDDPNVYRALGVDNWDGTGATPGTVAGHITVAVRGPAGGIVPTATKTSLVSTMQAQALAMLTVHVVDATVTAVNVAYTVHLLTGADATTVEAAIGTALAGYLSSDTWTWGGTVRANEIIPIIDAVDGVDYVAAVTVQGAATYSLPGAAPLAALGTVTPTIA